MFNSDKYKEQINKMCGRSGQSKSMIEQDIEDLLKLAVGYTSQNALLQVTNIGRPGKCDIVLFPSQKSPIVVEVKRPQDFKSKKDRNRAIAQASDYILRYKFEKSPYDPKHPYGIVTDGMN